MAYVEIRKSGKLITRRPVDEQQARSGLRIRIGSAGEVRVALGKPATLGDFQVQVFAAEPGRTGQEAGGSTSASSAGGGGTLNAKDRAEETGSMGELGFSAPGTETRGRQAEAAPEIEGYRVLGPIGQGGMGTVWRAEQLSTHREVALKLMIARGTSRDKAQARFEREVELTARLDHPNIGRIYDSGLCQGMCYYAMELIDGMPLDRYVQRLTLPAREILSLMRTVCQAVHYAHLHGIIHRDLKPSNIMVSHDGQPHVLDFGLARSFLHEEEAVMISLEGEVAGTPAYMAPEQARGRPDQIDTRTDVFSLGVILYQLLTGRPPHDLSGSLYDVLQRVIEGKILRPREASPSIDRELEALLLRALATDLPSRYASAGELADDIDNYLNGEPLRARVPTTFYFLSKRVRKHWRQVAVAAAVMAVVLGTLIAAYTKVVGEAAVRRAVEEEARIELGLKNQELDLAGLKLKALGKDKKEAEAAVNLLVDHYLAAEDRVSQLNHQLGQRTTTVLARGIGLQPGKPLGETVLVRTPQLPGQVAAWTVETRGHRAGVAKLTYSPDGRWLASAGADGTIRLWDGQAGHLSGMIVDPNGSVADVKWSNDGQSLVLLSATGQTHWWTWDSALRTARPIPASSQPAPVLAAEALAWSRRVGTQGTAEVLSRWSIHLSGARQALCRAATCMGLSPDRRTLAFADGEGAITLLNLESGLLKSACVPSWCGPLTAVAFSPQGDLFATCSGAGTLCLWDAHCWQPLRKFPAAPIGGRNASNTSTFCWAHDGQALALARGEAGAIDIVDVPSGRVLHTLRGKGQQITSVDWSVDGGTLAAGTSDGALLIWDMDSASPGTPREFAVGGSNVRAVLADPDPLRVVTATVEGKVTLWDVRESRVLRPLTDSAGTVRCLALGRDGKTVASVGGDQVLRLWDLQTGGLLRALKNDPNHPRSKTWAFSAVAWSPEARKLAAGASDGWITIWDTETRAAGRDFETHGGSVTALDWSPDGQLLLCGGADGTARAYDVKNGFRDYAVLLPLWGSMGAGIAISPEGDYRGPPESEDHLVYVVQTDKGQKALAPTEFRAQHGWVNEPWQVGLYRPGVEPMKRIYVKADAPGPCNGHTWATAFRDLQDALSAAQPDTEIWVTAGVYRPDRGTGARTASFRLKNGVRLFGGFAGREARVHERDPNLNETILSGDLKGNDGPNFTNNDENSYHVVVALNLDPNTVLDGFTIVGGNANGPKEGEHRFGGGVYNSNSDAKYIQCTFRGNLANDQGGGCFSRAHDRGPTFTGCRFIDNTVTERDEGMGGGLYSNGHYVAVNCVFKGNSSLASGGGMYNALCSPEISGSSFVGNTARLCGGAVANYNQVRLVLTRCNFSANSAGHTGGAMWNGAQCEPLLVESEFKGNSAGEGGAIFNEGSSPIARRCTFAANLAEGWGGAVYNDYGDGPPRFTTCLFSRNSARTGGGGAIASGRGGRPILLNCILAANSATSGGAISTADGPCETFLTNCLLIGNVATGDRAGAITQALESTLILVNCTLSGNTSKIGPAAIWGNENSHTRLANCILWGNTSNTDASNPGPVQGGRVDVNRCCIQGWTGQLGGTGNFGLDPLFVDPNGPNGKIGTLDDSFRLQPGSPCRDAGDNSALPADQPDLDGDGDPNEPIPFDIEGRPRIQNGRVDIGAYESDSPPSGGRP